MDKVKLNMGLQELLALEGFCVWYLNTHTPAQVRIETAHLEPHLRIVQRLVPLLMAKLVMRLAIGNAKGTFTTGKVTMAAEDALALVYAWTTSTHIPSHFGVLRPCIGAIDQQYA